MRHIARPLCVLFVGLMFAAAYTTADDTKDQPKPKNDIVGTWTLTLAKYGGTEVKFPEGSTHIKHVTPTQFMWATYDRDGKVDRAAGGGYTLKDDVYEEMPEYGVGDDFQIIKGKAQSFKCRVEGDKWYHDGKLSNGLTIEEVWQRVVRH